jgi:sigma-B regulation protein RsbU (phosphoserine phosphatase)
MIKLMGTDGSRFYSWELKPGKYVIGRSDQTDFIINDNTVSRVHASLTIEKLDINQMQYILEDKNSRNGTFVNNELIHGKKTVIDGDKIMFGQVEMRISSKEESDMTDQNVKGAMQINNIDPEKSVFLSINEALKPLPSKVTDQPDVLPTLFEMAKILVLPEPKQDMLQHALKLVGKVIPAERLAILSRMTDNELITSACVLPSGKDPGSFSLSNTIINEILSEQNSILIDPLDDPRYQGKDSIIFSDIKSAMAVPLFDDDQVLGILYVDTTNPLHRYNNDYLRLLATFGNLIASRLLNYELIHERQEIQVFEAELRRASMIQGNLLIKEMPIFEGYQLHAFQEQCRMVGGDLYDICLLEDGSLVFLVADVSGKGMGGALLMSNILASFRILYSETEFDLIKIINMVSTQMFKYSRAEDFATLFMGLIKPGENKVSFVNAGHNPPIIIRKDKTEEYLEPSGTMIGAFDFNTWSEQSTDLNEGDTLLVFTDGVVEADNDGKLYGDDRLEKLVKHNNDLEPEKLINVVVGDVLKFVKDSPRSDDITMIAIKRGN